VITSTPQKRQDKPLVEFCNVFFCGYWTHEGVPLLESTVRSVSAVVDAIKKTASGPASSISIKSGVF
jgi:hypothetical protein